MADQAGQLVDLLVRRIGTTTEIDVGGELDVSSVPALKRELSRRLREKPEILLLDLRRVTFIDSSGIALLLAARKHAIVAGSALVVIRPHGHADRIFALCGLDEMFPDVEASGFLDGQRTSPPAR
jgi:anti-sigma B factor antagonist